MGKQAGWGQPPPPSASPWPEVTWATCPGKWAEPEGKNEPKLSGHSASCPCRRGPVWRGGFGFLCLLGGGLGFWEGRVCAE